MKYSKPDNTLHICGKAYEINTDFRVWAEFSDKISTASEKDIFTVMLEFLSFQGLPLSKQSLTAVLAFFRCGNEDKDENEHRHNSEGSEKAVDFEKDMELITAAFRAQYNIDLRRDYLHWWDFVAMFKGLYDYHTISKIMQYRTIDLSKTDKQHRAAYKKLKEKYSLDDKKLHCKSLRERDDAMRQKIRRIQKEVNGSG